MSTRWRQAQFGRSPTQKKPRFFFRLAYHYQLLIHNFPKTSKSFESLKTNLLFLSVKFSPSRRNLLRCNFNLILFTMHMQEQHMILAMLWQLPSIRVCHAIGQHQGGVPKIHIDSLGLGVVQEVVSRQSVRQLSANCHRDWSSCLIWMNKFLI